MNRHPDIEAKTAPVSTTIPIAIGLLGLVLLVFFIAAPASAADQLARGFNVELARSFSQQEISIDKQGGLGDEERADLLALANTAYAFRAYLAGGRSAALRAALDAKERGVLSRLVPNDDDPTETAPWTYFFQGAVISLGHALAPTALAGFYNPIVDAWVVAELARTETGGYRLDGLSVISGDRLRAARAKKNLRVEVGLPPRWSQLADRSLAEALAASHGGNVALFEYSYPPLAKSKPPRLPATAADAGLVRSRLDLMGVTVRSLRDDAPHKQALDTLAGAIAAGDNRALDALVAGETLVPLQRITALPQQVRALFRPTGSYRGPDGLSVTLGTPYSGRWVMFADYEPAVGDAPPQLANLLLIDLAKGR